MIGNGRGRGVMVRVRVLEGRRRESKGKCAGIVRVKFRDVLTRGVARDEKDFGKFLF